MAAPHSNRISIRGWLVPLVALAVGLIVGENDAWIVSATLAVLLIGSVMVAVHHAELVALWLGEPYGTLVLTLAVTIIEPSLIISLMLTDEPSPGLARDTVHAVVMLVLNGLAGICIAVGILRHREQQFRTLGANAFLAVLMPMAMLVLVLPNHTAATPGPFYSTVQMIFVGIVCFALYLVFLFVQTVCHQDYFVPAGKVEADHAAAPSARIGAIRSRRGRANRLPSVSIMGRLYCCCCRSWSPFSPMNRAARTCWRGSSTLCCWRVMCS